MKRTELDKQVHSLRNIIFAMQGGLDALHQARNSDEDFDRIREAMADQIRKFRATVAEVDGIANRLREDETED